MLLMAGYIYHIIEGKQEVPQVKKKLKKMYTNNKCCTCVIKGNCYSLYSVLHQDRYHTVDYIS